MASWAAAVSQYDQQGAKNATDSKHCCWYCECFYPHLFTLSGWGLDSLLVTWLCVCVCVCWNLPLKPVCSLSNRISVKCSPGSGSTVPRLFSCAWCVEHSVFNTSGIMGKRHHGKKLQAAAFCFYYDQDWDTRKLLGRDEQPRGSREWSTDNTQKEINVFIILVNILLPAI